MASVEPLAPGIKWAEKDSNLRRLSQLITVSPLGHLGIRPHTRKPTVGLEPTTYALQVRCSAGLSYVGN